MFLCASLALRVKRLFLAVQVVSSGVRLLDGVIEVQHVDLELGSPIVDCSIADPYILVLAQDGQVVMLVLVMEQNCPKLIVSHPHMHTVSSPTPTCTR